MSPTQRHKKLAQACFRTRRAAEAWEICAEVLRELAGTAGYEGPPLESVEDIAYGIDICRKLLVHEVNRLGPRPRRRRASMRALDAIFDAIEGQQQAGE